MHQVFVGRVGVDEHLRHAVVVVFSGRLYVRVVEVEAHVKELLQGFDAEVLAALTGYRFGRARLKRHAINRDPRRPCEGGVTGKSRLGGEFITERLRANGIGVAIVGERASRVVGQGVGVDAAGRAADDDGNHRAVFLVHQRVGVEVVGRRGAGRGRRPVVVASGYTAKKNGGRRETSRYCVLKIHHRAFLPSGSILLARCMPLSGRAARWFYPT